MTVYESFSLLGIFLNLAVVLSGLYLGTLLALLVPARLLRVDPSAWLQAQEEHPHLWEAFTSGQQEQGAVLCPSYHTPARS